MKKNPEDILREIYRKIYEENRVFSIIGLINLTIKIILTIKIQLCELNNMTFLNASQYRFFRYPFR